MPEAPLSPSRSSLVLDPEQFPEPPPRAAFVELGLASNFSFLRGASHAAQLVLTARELGYDAIGIADANSMAGVVRIHSNAKAARLRPIIGCRIETVEGLAFLAYPTDRAAYGRLCQLISAGRRHRLDGEWQDKGVCEISLAMLAAHAEGVQLILLPPRDLEDVFEFQQDEGEEPTGRAHLRLVPKPPSSGPLRAILPWLAERLPTLRHVAASYLYAGDDIARIARLDALARANGLTILATNDVLYHEPGCRPLQDVMTAIRHKTTVAQAGLRLEANAERHLKSPAQMAALFARWPQALAAARAVADACGFSLDELQYEYPDEAYPDGLSAQAYLARLTWQGAARHYPDGVPGEVRGTLDHELGVIERKALARYFLTIRSIVDFARSRDILCQGRGSAANSAVCYCLGITAVDPAKHNLLFERFISEDRDEPPDIDVDFEHERREEVIQHIYRKYGRDRAGLCATVIHYRPRMAVREVGKAMGLSEDVTSALARTVWGGWGDRVEDRHVTETGLDLSDPSLRRVLTLTEQMIGMPRHLSQHVGGFILTERPLTETVPIGNGAMADRSFIEWDKDDIDDLGILKVDVLALGMLTCIRKGLALLKEHHGRELTLTTVPPEDPAVYDMLCQGDSLGVFQVESRAQMNMLPRLRPREFYDIVVQVAIVRPGPIQGDMVHPYLKQRKQRREGQTAFHLPGPTPEHGPPDELSQILGRTFGVPIFQEQAMKIAIDAAEFSSREANQLRKAMATFRARGNLEVLEERMVGRMVERGYDRAFAERCFNQIKGFGEYGFPESHAASFAILVYISSWLKCHYPAAFACALLNSQPMGFYAPAQIVRDAREHGVMVRPVDINHSDWDCTLEDQGRALRLGLRQIDGFPEHAAAKLVAARQAGGLFADVASLRDRAGLIPAQVERLASADAFSSLALPRRQALWEARSLIGGAELPLFAAMRTRAEGAERVATRLPAMPLSEEVVADYQTQRLSLKGHPLSFLRPSLDARGFVRAADLARRTFRAPVRLAGVVLVRQQPGSAKGVVFVTLEDETGVANVVIWPDMKARFRKVVMGARLMEVRGRVEAEEGVVHVIAAELIDASDRLYALSDDLLAPEMVSTDEIDRPVQDSHTRPTPPRPGHPRDVRVIPRSRDFH